MNYNVAPCEFCQKPMTRKQFRKSVYWLPVMSADEWKWCKWEMNFVFKHCHRKCWYDLKDNKRDLIKMCSVKKHEPRSLGVLV